jgi:Fur family zinc uptake transcriptional regulator
MSKTQTLTPHCQKVLALLDKSPKPLTAYDILDKLRKHGIKAPPTVYRALETLTEQGLVHRIETLGAFVACHEHESDHSHAQFAVCRECGSVEEIHDAQLTASIKKLAASLKFRIEREMLELMGLCSKCAPALKKA